MPETLFICHNCSHLMVADASLTGRKVACPECSSMVTVAAGARRVQCAKCEHRVRVSEQCAGQAVFCPECEETINVPLIAFGLSAVASSKAATKTNADPDPKSAKPVRAGERTGVLGDVGILVASIVVVLGLVLGMVLFFQDLLQKESRERFDVSYQKVVRSVEDFDSLEPVIDYLRVFVRGEDEQEDPYIRSITANMDSAITALEKCNSLAVARASAGAYDEASEVLRSYKGPLSGSTTNARFRVAAKYELMAREQVAARERRKLAEMSRLLPLKIVETDEPDEAIEPVAPDPPPEHIEPVVQEAADSGEPVDDQVPQEAEPDDPVVAAETPVPPPPQSGGSMVFFEGRWMSVESARVLRESARRERAAAKAREERPKIKYEYFFEPCRRCGGTGYKRGFKNADGSYSKIRCLTCKGRGKLRKRRAVK